MFNLIGHSKAVFKAILILYSFCIIGNVCQAIDVSRHNKKESAKTNYSENFLSQPDNSLNSAFIFQIFAEPEDNDEDEFLKASVPESNYMALTSWANSKLEIISWAFFHFDFLLEYLYMFLAVF